MKRLRLFSKTKVRKIKLILKAEIKKGEDKSDPITLIIAKIS